MEIKNLKNNIEFLKAEIQRLSSKIEDKSNVILNLQIQNLNTELKTLQNELKKFNERRSKEVIAIRLIGEKAKNGTFPLISVGGITDNFAKALFKTSQYLQYGNKGGKKIEKVLNETLDLRLESIGQGSTIFYISGKTSPNLFGESIIQNSLENSFDLLDTENSDEILDKIENIGVKSTKHLKDFFGEIIKDDLEVEITWEDYNFNKKKWYGTKEKLISYYNSFVSINTQEPEIIDDDFEIITISLKHKIEVRDIIDGKIFSIKYPFELTDFVKSLRIGEIQNLNISKTTIINKATQQEKIEYILLG